jgi:hypothetical protein
MSPNTATKDLKWQLRLIQYRYMAQQPISRTENCPFLVRFHVLTAVSIKTVVFWAVVPYSRAWLIHRPDDGGSEHLRNVGKFPQDYTAQQLRRQPLRVHFQFCYGPASWSERKNHEVFLSRAGQLSNCGTDMAGRPTCRLFTLRSQNRSLTYHSS